MPESGTIGSCVTCGKPEGWGSWFEAPGGGYNCMDCVPAEQLRQLLREAADDETYDYVRAAARPHLAGLDEADRDEVVRRYRAAQTYVFADRATAAAESFG